MELPSDPKQQYRDEWGERHCTQVAFHLMTEPTPAKNHARELPNTLGKTQSAVNRSVRMTSLTTTLQSRLM